MMFDQQDKLQPEAILFDMDGVLIDSIDSWHQAMNAALEQAGKNKISKEEFIDKYWGHELYENLRRVGLDEKIGRFCNTIYAEHIDRLRLFPATKKVLSTLDGYRKGIITNTSRDCTMQILKQFDLKQFFRVVITSDQIDKGKPDPAIVLEGCRALGEAPENVVVIGDTTADVKAGRAAGCIVVGVNVQGDYTIEKLSELIELLKI